MKANEKLRKDLDNEQVLAVEAPVGDVIVNALAGSGKTRVLTYRVANMIDKGYDPRQMMLLTFTNKAAEEMIGRIRELLGSQKSTVTSGTFHSIAIRMLRQYKENFNLVPLDEDSKAVLINKIRKEIAKREDIQLGELPAARKLAGFFSSAINHNISLSEIVNEAGFFGFEAELIYEIKEKYEMAKKEQLLMDFDDMLLHFMEALDNKNFLAAVQNRYKYFFVDEYQDINWMQHKILMSLSSKDRNLFAIGDPYQCIYQFRGSDETYIKNFKQDYPNAKEFTISTNYRSKEKILLVAESVIQNNADEDGVKFIAHNKGGTDVEIISYGTNMDQAFGIMRYIDDYIPKDKLKEATVLVRTRRQMYPFETAAKNLGIPIKLWGAISLFERKHIKDVVLAIKTVFNHMDYPSFMNFAKMFPGVGEVTANNLYEENILYYGDFSYLQEKHKLFQVLFEMSLKNSVSDQIDVFMELFYNDRLKKESAEEEEDIADIELLKTIASRYPNTIDFLEKVSLEEDLIERSRDLENVENKVNVMTMHKSKGLEWDYVFIPNVNQGQFPRDDKYGTHYFNNSKSIQDERNLFYVSITRASKECQISYITEGGFNSFGDMLASPFIGEITEVINDD